MALHAGHKLYTSADLRALEALPENADKKFELIAGEIFDVATMPPQNALIMLLLGCKILQVAQNGNLGYVFTNTIGYQLSDVNVLIPSVSYVSKQRLPSLDEKPTFAPNLAVEVVSSPVLDFKKWRTLRNKILTCLRNGTERVWVVFPEALEVEVYRLEADGSLNVRTLTIEDTLDGGEVLPGLSIPVREIFPPQSAA